MSPKSIFRRPGAKHFQLVHRSQRDPRIHDPDASQHVLKPVERENQKKGKTRADLDAIFDDDEQLLKGGEALKYGVYYDDTDYDYMQHLRPIGVQEDGVDSVLIEAPLSIKAKSKKPAGLSLVDIPADALPSAHELPRTYESQQAVPESIAGFQPDMDPHLRQVLEALEDDAFVDDGLSDDFFGDLVKDGERGNDEDVHFEFHEEGVAEVDEPESKESDDWEHRFAQFKKTHKSGTHHTSDDEDESETGDTVSGLPRVSVIGGKKRRKGSSVASGYSMSSSSMYRNDALQLLDDRFDHMIAKTYNEEEEEEELELEDAEDSDEAPELITSREDFDSMVNEFLDDYEILGRKLKPKLEGETGIDKLNTIRRALGQDQRVRIASGESEDDQNILVPEDMDDEKNRWDCETVLSTYSNLENHPRLIRARESRSVPKIRLDPKTGLPLVVPSKDTPARQAVVEAPEQSDSGSDTEREGGRKPIMRPRNETPEAKKARKAAVKAERQARREHKRATKEQFHAEQQTQTRTLDNRGPRMKKL